MDPDKIKGNIHQPYKPQQEQEASKKVDPEKFKKVMKVEESEESQKRKKRNLSREEEEGEDEPAVEETPKPSGSFSEFMGDKEELDSVFDKESGGVRRQAAPQEGAFIAPPEELISTEGVEVDEEPQAPPPPQAPSSAPPEQSSQPPTQEPPSETPSSSTPQTPSSSEQPQEEPSENLPQFEGEFEPQEPYQPQQQQQPTTQEPSSTQQPDQPQPAQQAQEPTKKEQSDQEQMPKKKEEDTSLLASQPKKSDLDALKKKPKTGLAPEIKTIPKEKEQAEKKTSVQQDVIDKPSAFLHIPTPPTKEKIPEAPTKETPEGPTEAKDPDAKILPIDEAFSGEQPKEKGPEEEKKEEVAPTPGKDKQAGPFQRFTPEEVRNQKVGKEATTSAAYEELPVPTSTESEQGEMGEQEKKKEDQTFAEASSDTAGIPLPTFDNPVPSITPSAETPAYSKLSPEMHELFEKIGGVILVQQEKGVTTTTVNVNMLNSVFDGTQVILDQYSTAPNSYNIQLVGNPESIKVFSQNINALKDSFKQANFNFEVNIQNPILIRGGKKPHLIRRKESAGGKKEK